MLNADLELKSAPNLFLADQLTGVEGYVERAASGIYASIVAARRQLGLAAPVIPRASSYDSLAADLLDETEREFAPMNINWGLFPPREEPIRDKSVKRAKILEQAESAFADWTQRFQLTVSGYYRVESKDLLDSADLVILIVRYPKRRILTESRTPTKNVKKAVTDNITGIR